MPNKLGTMDLSLARHERKYTLSVWELALSIFTFSAIPWGGRHLTLYRQSCSSDQQNYYHLFAGLAHHFPFLGLALAVIEYYLVFQANNKQTLSCQASQETSPFSVKIIAHKKEEKSIEGELFKKVKKQVRWDPSVYTDSSWNKMQQKAEGARRVYSECYPEETSYLSQKPSKLTETSEQPEKAKHIIRITKKAHQVEKTSVQESFIQQIVPGKILIGVFNEEKEKTEALKSKFYGNYTRYSHQSEKVFKSTWQDIEQNSQHKTPQGQLNFVDIKNLKLYSSGSSDTISSLIFRKEEGRMVAIPTSFIKSNRVDPVSRDSDLKTDSKASLQKNYETTVCDLEEKDFVLTASGGFWGVITLKEVTEYLALHEEESIDVISKGLLTLAVEKQGLTSHFENISLVAARIYQKEEVSQGM